MDWLVEEMLRAAMARGDFDDLPGKGKPQNLTPISSRLAVAAAFQR
jgi:hypothetical protein